MIKKVILFGKIPPPVGGVTRSVENLFNALKSKNIEVEIFSKQSLWKIKRFDIAHIHYSKSWKRFLGLILGKLLAKRVVFTLHGNKYNSDVFNALNAKLTEGVVFLNNTASSEYKNNFKKSIILTSIFKEGMAKQVKQSNIIDKKTKKIYLLVYAYDKVFQDGKDIYGIDFILNNLNKLDDQFVVIFVDPKSAYKNDISNSEENLIYLNYEVDFVSLLREVDIYIRPTSTDGNSVAVQEALMLEKKVVASDVVERGECVMVYQYNNFEDFAEKLNNVNVNSKPYEPDSIVKYLEYLEEL